MAFAELGLCSELIRAVEDLGWILPTPVQQEAIPLVLGGGDVLAAAETGSGKTGAFALPILQIVHETLREQRTQQTSDRAHPQQPAGSSSDTASAAMGEDRDGLLRVSPDGLQCACDAGKAWAGGRADVGVLGGSYCFEAQQSTPGLLRLGWSTISAKLALGTCPCGFGFGGTGKKSNKGAFDSYGEEFGEGDVMGCVLNRDARTISFFKNGVALGEAFALPPALDREAFYPAVCLKGCAVRLNFGELEFGHAYGATLPLEQVASAHATRRGGGGGGSGGGGGGGGGGGAGGRAPMALILEPARDLCEQVCLLVPLGRRCAPWLERTFSAADAPVRGRVRPAL